MKLLYCPECQNYLEGGDGECHDCSCGWKQPCECVECAPLEQDTFKLSDSDLCAIQIAVETLRVIADRHQQQGDVLVPVNDIRTASRKAAYALKRFEPVAHALLALESEHEQKEG